MHHGKLLGREHSAKKSHREHTKKTKSTNLSKRVYVSLRVSPLIITSTVGRLYHSRLRIGHLISVKKYSMLGSVEKHGLRNVDKHYFRELPERP